MKKILVQANESDQIRLAVVNDGTLAEFKLHDASKPKTKSNIYYGKVFRIEPGLESAFIDYGAARHGFLPLKEVCDHYLQKTGESENGKSDSLGLTVGQNIIVQVVKEERGSKGAALTCNISLAGKYLVFSPYGNANGISRRVSAEDRPRLKKILDNLKVPENAGAILRTAGANQSQDEIQQDLDALVHYWKKIQEATERFTPPKLLSEESGFFFSLLRDYVSSNEVESIVFDSAEHVAECSAMASILFAENAHKIEHYTGKADLFSHHGVDGQLARLFQREIRLPSGGSIVIDPTEALVAIDVNSARAIQWGSIEETALTTNLEAVEEIANQLRFRDIGGLIVIDFIDMKLAKNRKSVADLMQEKVRIDRARIQVSEMSRFGLLEMSRQHLGSALHEMMPVNCSQCNGTGRLIAIDDIVNSALQDITKAARSYPNCDYMHVEVPLVVAEQLGNSKRSQLSMLEKECNITISIASDISFGRMDYIIRVSDAEGNNTTARDTRILMKHQKPDNGNRTKPAVHFRGSQESQVKGFWAWITSLFSAKDNKSVEQKEVGGAPKTNMRRERSGNNPPNRGRRQDRTNNSNRIANARKNGNPNREAHHNRHSGSRKSVVNNKEEAKNTSIKHNANAVSTPPKTGNNNDQLSQPVKQNTPPVNSEVVVPIAPAANNSSKEKPSSSVNNPTKTQDQSEVATFKRAPNDPRVQQ